MQSDDEDTGKIAAPARAPSPLTDHKINGCNEQIEITPGYAERTDPWIYTIKHPGLVKEIMLAFQHGPIEQGVNGITNEALLAIVIDRLRGFQSGPQACRENALVLTKIEEAMHWLQHRTRARLARGVEGTRTP